MAASQDAICLTRWRSVGVAVCLALAYTPLSAQTRISLAQLGFRTAPDYSAVYTGQKVIVRGVVSAPAFHFTQYSLLAIQDARNGGVLKLPVPDTSLDRFHPGDEIEAMGTVVTQYGMAMLAPDTITVLGRTTPPQPKLLSVQDLQSTAHLGELVRIQGRVQESPGYNAGGALITLPGRQEPYRLFIPRAPGARQDPTGFDPHGRHSPGYRHRPAIQPDHSVQHRIRTAGGGHRRHRAHGADPPAVPQPVIATGITAILSIGFFLWSRERRLRAQRRRAAAHLQIGRGDSGRFFRRHHPEAHIGSAARHYRRHARTALCYNRTAKTPRCHRRRWRGRRVHFALVASRRHPGGRRGLLPLPHPAGDSGHRPQPVPRGGQDRRTTHPRASCSSP